MLSTNDVGERTESLILTALIHTYPTVLIPFGDNKRYDFVFEDYDKTFKRVQSKTGRYKNGCIRFNAYSSNYANPEHRTYHGEIDFFGVSCPEFTGVYLIPVEETGKGEKSLRVDSNITNRGGPLISWAKDYLIYDSCKH